MHKTQRGQKLNVVRKVLTTLNFATTPSFSVTTPSCKPYGVHEFIVFTNSHDLADDAPWIVPFERNPRFTGREIQLAKLQETLFVGGQTAKVTVIGLGGVGKTQLVLKLIYRIRENDKNCSVIWIPATNLESLHQAYVDVVQQLSTPGWEEDKADVKRLM